MSGRPLIGQLLPLLGAEGAHALLHFSALKPSDPASASCELAAGREARTQLHQLLRSEPSLKPLEAQTRVRKLARTDLWCTALLLAKVGRPSPCGRMRTL
mgnify:CR=1 FL=1